MKNTHTRASLDQLISLSDACAALDQEGLPKPRGGYRALQTLAASAAFPCEKRNNRWYIRRGDLPAVAASYSAKSGDAGAS